MNRSALIVSPEALDHELGHAGLRVVDASWYLPGQERDAAAEFEAAHVPGAMRFDHDLVVAPGSALPHALPDADTFARALSSMGISDQDRIVVYDGMGLFSAARLWWMLRLFGSRDVRVLDGGLPAWRAAGLRVESGPPASAAPAVFVARLDETGLADLAEMQRTVRDGSRQIVDARSAERFRGEAPEPREGVRRGHMPGARSLPFTSLQRDGRLLDGDELAAAFAAAGIDPGRPITTSCGSGVTAAVVNLALAALDRNDVRLYDGSWAQWGSQPNTPVETGAAR